MPHIEFAYNHTLPSSTNCSPFEIVYGFNLLTPMDLIQLAIDKQVSLDGKKKAECNTHLPKPRFPSKVR